MPLRRAFSFPALTMLFVASLFAQKTKPPTVRAVPPIATIHVCDPNHFLSKAYQDLLGRPIDPGASAYWLGAMKNGMSRTQVATQLLRSAEYSNARLQSLYNTCLHRAAGGSEIGYFATMLQQGTSIDQVEALILSSNEYFNNRGGGTNQGFINALYQDVLGRAADAQAVSFFSQQLGAGGNRTTVAQQVLTSAEARARWVSNLYSRFLHHAAPGAVNGDHDQVAANIIGSEEYCRQ